VAVREAVQEADEVDSPGGYRERKLTLEVEVVLTKGTLGLLSGLDCCSGGLVLENQGTSRRERRRLVLNVRGQTQVQNNVIEGRSA